MTTVLQVNTRELGKSLAHHCRGGIHIGARLIADLPPIRTMMSQFGRHVDQILALRVGGRDILSQQGRVDTEGTGEGLMSSMLLVLAERS